MAERYDRLKRANATVIVVSFDIRERAEALRERLRLPFTLALDPDRAGYRAFGLGRASFPRVYLHPDVVLFYAKALMGARVPRLRRHQDRRQLGGDFVLDADSVVVLAHPERGPEDRVPVAAIVRAVEEAASTRGGPQ